MSPSQANEPFDTPNAADIPTITTMHVSALEQSDDDAVWVGAGMRQLLFQTVGRKSGKTHTVTCPYWVDAGGDRIVVASFAGQPKHPAWFHNLADKEANPQVLCREKQHVWWSDAQVLEGADRAETWAALTADRPFYNDYQAKCDRTIPLIRLPETSAGEWPTSSG